MALRLNNRYFLDGRDANSFTNVGWLFGLHDRPWGRRPSLAPSAPWASQPEEVRRRRLRPRRGALAAAEREGQDVGR